MPQNFILGIDCGSTTTKAVIFSPVGQIMGIGRARIVQHMDRPHHVERDLHETWCAVAATVRDALADAKLDGHSIASVGVTAHGDGLFLLDRLGNPLGRGIMSLDSRGRDVHESWKQEGLLDQLMPISGQRPYPYSATTILAWLRDHEPERYHAIGSVIFAKDWIRLCLTGRVATDLTEASTAFTDLHTQDYSDQILSLLGLSDIRGALPEILLSCDLAGVITPLAAAATGLLAGTPVSAGLHDVTSAAVGLGNTRAGDMTITAGTFSINEVFRDRPVVGNDWACRAGYRRGLWNCMAISPASSSNLEWMAQILLPDQSNAAAALLKDVEARLLSSGHDHAVPIYHPYLFGSPYEMPASASFFGVQSWHDRTDLLQAIVEGTIFNHRQHVEALRRTGAVNRIGVSGGGSGQAGVAQLFANILGQSVEISEVREAGALGAALTAAVSVGIYPELEQACAAQCVGRRAFKPDPEAMRFYDGAYHHYVDLIQALQPFWPRLYDGKYQSSSKLNVGVPMTPQVSESVLTEANP
ncbi:FGGY-family carbohydrate kinase [Kozakia baliensis]|uniref:FGGY-family carbohydrate kinase n=1 Tax=Kozakia baliensis TaxID=153496 RepID=UPI00345B5E66